MKDPFRLLAEILETVGATETQDSNAMVLCSVDERGRPSSRAVLLKALDRRGLVFYTNLGSRKARQIERNPNVSLHFLWRRLGRQVSIEGEAGPVSPEEADSYFATRDRGSQIGAWASKQSQPLPHRSTLLSRVVRDGTRFAGQPVPRPPHWSGFRVAPWRFEFWEAGKFRLHDRRVYELREEGWSARKLYP